MTTAQQHKIKELQQDYVVSILQENVSDVHVRASNGITYRNYIIGPRGGMKLHGMGKENGNDLLKRIENEI